MCTLCLLRYAYLLTYLLVAPFPSQLSVTSSPAHQENVTHCLGSVTEQRTVEMALMSLTPTVLAVSFVVCVRSFLSSSTARLLPLSVECGKHLLPLECGFPCSYCGSFLLNEHTVCHLYVQKYSMCVNGRLLLPLHPLLCRASLQSVWPELFNVTDCFISNK